MVQICDFCGQCADCGQHEANCSCGKPIEPSPLYKRNKELQEELFKLQGEYSTLEKEKNDLVIYAQALADLVSSACPLSWFHCNPNEAGSWRYEEYAAQWERRADKLLEKT